MKKKSERVGCFVMVHMAKHLQGCWHKGAQRGCLLRMCKQKKQDQ